jgi:hypothetical protein
MKTEEAFKIQTELKLLEAGMYDKEVYEYINGIGNEQYLSDWEFLMFKRIDERHRNTTGKVPSNEQNRIWYFRIVMHPELFR